jgi:hypothetical protein
MALHPAENRGYRELYLSGRQAVKRLERLASTFEGGDTETTLEKAAGSIAQMLDELTPLTARHDLHGGPTAQGGGANIGTVRGAVFDRFLERNQALRQAVGDVEHVATLLAYLAKASETRGDSELPEFCGTWERRLRRQLGAIRKAAVDLGADPDAAVQPLDDSTAGRAAHRVAWAFGTVGEWTDRRLAQRKRGG